MRAAVTMRRARSKPGDDQGLRRTQLFHSAFILAKEVRDWFTAFISAKSAGIPWEEFFEEMEFSEEAAAFSPGSASRHRKRAARAENRR
jgi:hypothetical protein